LKNEIKRIKIEIFGNIFLTPIIIALNLTQKIFLTIEKILRKFVDFFDGIFFIFKTEGEAMQKKFILLFFTAISVSLFTQQSEKDFNVKNHFKKIIVRYNNKINKIKKQRETLAKLRDYAQKTRAEIKEIKGKEASKTQLKIKRKFIRKILPEMRNSIKREINKTNHEIKFLIRLLKDAPKDIKDESGIKKFKKPVKEKIEDQEAKEEETEEEAEEKAAVELEKAMTQETMVKIQTD